MRELLGLVAALGLFLLPSTALALPPFDGGMSFGPIEGQADPEEFSWEVQLGSDQELKQIDDQNAAVVYADGERTAFGIAATSAHDAEGATVPTTLAVSGENVVTLTVHHRAGNPAAGGVSFDYPIVGGEGWEGGFQTRIVQMPPAETLPVAAPDALCAVPRLIGGSLKANRKKLAHANCKLGKVRGNRSRGAKVVKQDLRSGTILPARSSVSVKIG